MTYREKFLQEHPDYTDADIDSSCPWVLGCPHYENGRVMDCDDCWDREVPVDDITVCQESLPAVGMWTWREESPQFWTGGCPNCHKQDNFDPLAKYCHYCGARLEVKRNEQRLCSNQW